MSEMSIEEIYTRQCYDDCDTMWATPTVYIWEWPSEWMSYVVYPYGMSGIHYRHPEYIYQSTELGELYEGQNL